ncbi:MAG: hypothetical protein AAFY08_11285 [Planctomycetota bacterium]
MRDRPLAAVLLAVLLAGLAAVPAVADDDKAHRAALLADLEVAQAQHRESPDDPAAAFALARAWYGLGVNDDKKAAKRAEEQFDALHEAHPDEPIVIAYLGSCRLLHAKREWAPWRKYELSKQGVTLMNDAVERAPEDRHVRFIRAATTDNLPDRFELGEQTDADFAWLAERIHADPTHADLDGEQAAYALVRHAVRLEGVENHGDALAAYRLATELAPDSRSATEARASIERIETFYTPAAESTP